MVYFVKKIFCKRIIAINTFLKYNQILRCLFVFAKGAVLDQIKFEAKIKMHLESDHAIHPKSKFNHNKIGCLFLNNET